MFKAPITDSVKKSKKGKLILTEQSGVYETIQHAQNLDTQQSAGDVLIPVFENGTLLVDHSLDSIRERARKGLMWDGERSW